jgi:hypothetical protein
VSGWRERGWGGSGVLRWVDGPQPASYLAGGTVGDAIENVITWLGDPGKYDRFPVERIARAAAMAEVFGGEAEWVPPGRRTEGAHETWCPHLARGPWPSCQAGGNTCAFETLSRRFGDAEATELWDEWMARAYRYADAEAARATPVTREELRERTGRGAAYARARVAR